MSLQTGQPLCRLVEPIINPYSLRIAAFYVAGPLVEFNPAVVFAEDIREFGRMGAIVDSVDNVMSTDGLVRLNQVIEYQFVLINLLVVDEYGRKLGKVTDYTVDLLNYEIQQLYVKPRFLRSFTMTDLIINRRQIIKVEPNRITVKVPTVEDRVKAKPPLMDDARRVLNPDFDNPFRKKPALNNSKR